MFEHFANHIQVYVDFRFDHRFEATSGWKQDYTNTIYRSHSWILRYRRTFAQKKQTSTK